MNIYLIFIFSLGSYVCYANSKEEALDLYDPKREFDNETQITHLGYASNELQEPKIILSNMKVKYNYKTIATNLRVFRARQNITQTEMAKVINISTAMLSALEHGKRKLNPRHIHLINLAYNIDIENYQ